MIAKIIKQIVADLNTYLDTIYPASGVDQAKFMHLNDKTFEESIGTKIAVNLINIEEDKTYKNHLTPYTSANPSSQTHPLGGELKMRINLYLIFAFNPGTTPEQYGNAVTLLTHVLRYFNETSSRMVSVPVLNTSYSLDISYHNISLEDSNNMWSNLGGEQKPYAMYQVKMLEIDPIQPASGQLSPTITSPINPPIIN